MAAAVPFNESTFQRWTRRIGLYVLTPLVVIAALPVTIHIIQKPDLGLSVHRLQVESVQTGGPADRAGIRAGDRIVAFGDRPVSRMVDWFAATAGDYSLEPRNLGIERDGRETTLTVVPQRASRAKMVYELATWLSGLSFLLIGWWVHSRRWDVAGRSFFGLSLIFAFFLADVPPNLPSESYLEIKEMLRELLQYLWPVYFLRFFLIFPAAGTIAAGGGGRHLFVPAGVLIALTLLGRVVGVAERSLPASILQGAAMIFFLIYFVAGLVVFARKVLRRDRPIQHTKLRLILLGLVAGLVPFLAASAVGAGTLPSFRHWEFLGFSLVLVPVSFGLAIMRYGALDTAFVVRTSLIYGLLTAVILAGYFLVAGLLGTWLTRVYLVSAYPVTVLVIAAASLAVLPLRRRVQGWVDAAFYPSRRANRDAIARLGRSLATQVNAAAAHDLLLAELHELYRPTRLALYLTPGPDAGDLVEVGRRPSAAPPGPRLELADPLVVALDRLRRPLFFEEFEDWANGRGRQTERTTALPADHALLVPLVTGNRLLGALAFGPKSGGALYSQEDLANLATLSLQAAPVLESLRLYADSFRQRQLETELAVARDIQAQLLPTEPLESDGVRICGRNDACRLVGGDYYDFFPLVEGRSIGFCIADVAGDGIPAALLMTTVRVTFRELALPGVPPERVITQLDRRLGEILSPGRFISLFYGVLDHEDQLLSYCNAGQEPPLLYRRDGATESLRRGGPLLGIEAGVPFRRGTIRLEPGDLLIGYTDGITEQTSPDGKEFFEVTRLQTMIAEVRDRSPEDICSHIFARVTAFGGEAASDDRTVIVMKYK
ncbi:MAG TPA: SpoIIE family protein phosphatase [Candidatus Krumholzibacteria bacterium]|nr:SpoIIE family protein phosphatase [Candidatus Krumholzibacteria bacterium]HPD72806.1 SpoIIE family protein phosphatase [Candidatus Krumholzibacteria bacterium]HRY40262.1 SpoIIE family protein phosphatase [Candidatus Krumholzibacteria bacterium]